MVCILDYGSGNVRSVLNMLNHLGYKTKISNKEADILAASHLIMPGVGAFSWAMEKIRQSIPLATLKKVVVEGHKPFLGICVGMQVLANSGQEFGIHSGLGWIAGRVNKLDSHGLPLPHVGWNNIEAKKKSLLTKDLSQHPDFYYVHSYVFVADNSEDVIATTTYGDSFASIIQKNNIFGVQFHPEKSQKAGEQLLKDFLGFT